MSPRPASERICDLVVAGMALWTLCCHAVVAAGGSLHDLMAVAALAGLAAIAFTWHRRRAGEGAPAAAPVAAAPESRDADPPAHGLRFGGLALGAVVLVVFLVTGNVVLLWWGSLLVLAVGLALCLREGDRGVPIVEPDRSPSYERALWAMGAACVAIVFFFHRADSDTPFYIAMATAAVDAPGVELMLDPIHGIEGLALHMPAHRIHSFELLPAALSWVTGIPVLHCSQWGIGVLGALLVPLAFAALFRILTPRYWVWAVLLVLVALLGARTSNWHGNFSVLRSLHGKSVLLSVFLPLAYAYGLRFGASPSWRRWWLLVAVQIASVGASSSAIWSAPIATGLAAAAAVRLDRRAVAVLACAAASSFYAVGAGLSLLGDMAPVAAHVEVVTSAPGDRLADALARTVGHEGLAVLAIGSLLGAWALQPRGLARRFAVVVPLGVLLVVLAPYLEEAVARAMTGPSYRRGFWALPLPVLVALALSSPLQSRRFARAARAAVLGAAFAIFAFVPPRMGQDPRVHFGWPRSKVNANRHAVAEKVVRHAPEGALVVAPQQVALWVPVFHDSPPLLFMRESYLQGIERAYGSEDAQLRMEMSEILSNGGYDVEGGTLKSEGYRRRLALPDRLERFAAGLGRYRVRVVVLNGRAPLAAGVRAALKQEGFEAVDRERGYQIWVRAAPYS